jgi:hypothetical protein
MATPLKDVEVALAVHLDYRDINGSGNGTANTEPWSCRIYIATFFSIFIPIPRYLKDCRVSEPTLAFPRHTWQPNKGLLQANPTQVLTQLPHVCPILGYTDTNPNTDVHQICACLPNYTKSSVNTELIHAHLPYSANPNPNEIQVHQCMSCPHVITTQPKQHALY